MILLFFFLVPSGGFPCLLLAGWPYNFLSALGQAGCWASGSTVSAGVCPNLLWYYIISSYRCVWGELSGYEGHRGPMYRMETAACSCVLGDRVPAMLSSFCTLLTFCFLECFFFVCLCLQVLCQIVHLLCEPLWYYWGIPSSSAGPSKLVVLAISCIVVVCFHSELYLAVPALKSGGFYCLYFALSLYSPSISFLRQRLHLEAFYQGIYWITLPLLFWPQGYIPSLSRHLGFL